VVRVVSTRPELVRSWVSDAVGVGDPEFEWHDLARTWQAPQAGEDFWEQQLAVPARQRAGARTVALDGLGHWWMLRDPARAAAVLREFWATVA